MSYDFCLIFLLIGIMMMFSGFVFGLHYAFLIIGFCFITGSILLLLYNKIIVYLFLFSSSIFFLYDVFLLVTSLMKYKIDYLIDGIKITIFILLFYIVVSFIFIKYLKYRKTDDIKNYTLKLHPIVTVGFIDLVILVIWLIFVFWPMKLEKVDESIFKIDGYNYELTKEENGLYLLPEIFSDFQNCENMEMKGYASGNCNDELFKDYLIN